MRWYLMDLHMHTPGSSDYQEPGTTYLDILRRAELRGLDIIAFTDHNTVQGYKGMMTDIDQLEMLDRLGRATPEEHRRLADYRRLLDKILVLPGFEFTATFGFHILGIFSPRTPIRQLEHILLSLNIPPPALDEGSSNVGASSDVLTAYRTINEAGGIVIAAHVNSAHGVAMRGLDFGGQTKIAYTQDPYLHALEATDLDRRGPGGTARFFDGSKSEYPRRMRIVQGSDAHRLDQDPRNDKSLGIGDRPTEIQLDEPSFEALREVFQSADFARTRPFRGPLGEVYDYVQLAREKGPERGIVFHESARDTVSIVNDICALANSGGGLLYVGASADPTVAPVGTEGISRTIELVRNEAMSRITPALRVTMEPVESSGRVIVRVQVPQGADLPYAVDDSRIYIRNHEGKTLIAGREQIIRLVASAAQIAESIPVPAGSASFNAPLGPITRNAPQERASNTQERIVQPRPQRLPRSPRPAPIERTPAPVNGGMASAPPVASIPPAMDDDDDDMTLPPQQTVRAAKEPVGAGGAPRSGVEIMGTELRRGVQYHVMRNLQNGQTVPNVTRTSARHLWQYAIIQKETSPVDVYGLKWVGNVALIRRYRRGNVIRYDLAMRDPNGTTPMRVFYGVTEEGLTGAWLQFASDAYPIEEESRN